MNVIRNWAVVGIAHHRIILNEDGLPVDYEFLDINEEFEIILGKKKAEIIGNTALKSSFESKNALQPLIEIFGETALNGVEQSFEQYRKSNDKWYQVHVYSTQKLFFTAVYKDITRRVEDQDGNPSGYELVKTAYELTENIPVGTYTMVQPGGGGMAYFAFMSSRFLELTGLTRQEAASDPLKGFACVHPEDYDDWVVLNVQAFENKTPFYGETRVIVKGEVRWITAESIPRTLSDGSTAWEGVLADITDRKITEEKLRKAVIESDALRQKAEEANRAKSEFLANMSHEIRTPLNGVIGFTELLKDTPLSAAQKEFVDNANLSGHNLLGIINDILDFSKIEAGMMELESIRTDIIELVENAVDIMKFSAFNRNLEVLLDIEHSFPRYAWVDQIRLNQVLTNLLGNALKFTQAGEIELKVRFKPVDSETGTFYFSVRDTGIGVTENQKQKLFKAFSQADSSTTRRFGGTGLGLIISDRIVQKMGGNIQIDSIPGEGAVFNFHFDAKFEQGQAMNPIALKGIEKCIVIDQNESSRTLLHRMITDLGVQCESFDNVLEYYNRPELQGHYDAVICSHSTAGVDGLKFANKMRDNGNFSVKTLPLILLHSLIHDEQFKKSCRELGIRCCISKPIKQDQLFGCLASMRTSPTEETTLIQGSATSVSRATSQVHIGLSSEQEFRILVAEDVPVNKLLIHTILKKLYPSSTIIETDDGAQTIHEYKKHIPDLILMDLQMPELDGIETTIAIRDLERSHSRKPVPIIALTARAMIIEIERCFQAGMDGFLTKPVNLDKLKVELSKYLEGKTTTS
jgi:PAS domain S-box-containing protein